MTYIYEYRKNGVMDEYFIRTTEGRAKLDNLMQVIELLGTAAYVGKEIERIDYPTTNVTAWIIK